jgi:misacylated tRNA(Ala) deacylase
MTERLYHDDSYLTKFQAVVVGLDADHHGLVLDQTAFYPGGGGQPPDSGKLEIDGVVIEPVKAKIISGELVHLLPEDYVLPNPGAEVRGEINWQLRLQLMRTHTAMHVLCGVIFRDYGASVTGGNMTPLQGRMDFEFASLQKDLVSVIEAEVNSEIQKAHPVTWKNLPRDEALQIPDLIRTKVNLIPSHIKTIRVVEIQGLDLQADGGTHVKNTSEVGEIKISDYKSKGKDNKRIYLEVLD